MNITYKDVIEFYSTLPDITLYELSFDTGFKDNSSFHGMCAFFNYKKLPIALIYEDKVICCEVNFEEDDLNLFKKEKIFTYDYPGLLDSLNELYVKSAYNIKQEQIKVKKESLNKDFILENQVE